ncbi:MAG TPA: hypothetical protein VNA30_04415 [Mycobacteriales bacterium]|nr:hypothetical protein [Mycobacteriales bacterium]
MRTRWLITTLLVIPLIAPSGHAAPTKVPQVKDAAGDAAGGQSGMDIVSVLYTTAGTGTGKRYVPKKLIVTMTLGGPVETRPVVNYEAEAKTEFCGDVTLTYAPGTPYEQTSGFNGWVRWGNCTVGDSTSDLLTATADGKTVRWEFALRATPIEVGTMFSNFRARVDPANPVLPLSSSDTATERGLIDIAAGAGSWKVG